MRARRPRPGIALVVAALVVAVAVPLAGGHAASARPEPTGPAIAAVRVASDADLAALAGFDLTEARHGDHVDVVLWPGDLARLRRTGLPHRIVASGPESPASAHGYRVLADYERDLQALAERYPGHARVLTGPQRTWEGRRVLGIEIADRVADDDGRPTAVILGLHHAREWPSGELTMDFATELATGFGTDPRITDLLRRARVLLVPVVNPDGFNHSRESVVEARALGAVAGGQGAYWRKNRRGPMVAGQNPVPYGVDPNRNYGQHWGSGRPLLGTTSSNPTEQSYQGHAPFSEAESANVRHWVLSRPVTTLVTNHTYSNLVLWPWGWTDKAAPDAAAFEQLGRELAAGNGYRPMQSSQLYPTTGTTEDWAYASTGTLGFTFEHGRSFHPAYERTYRALYEQNRGAFLHLVAAAADPSRHSVIEGQITSGGTGVPAHLRLRRTGSLPLAPGNPSDLDEVTDAVDLTMTAGADGHFRWHVNPSTRPVAAIPEAYELTATLPDGRLRTMPVTVSRGGTAAVGTLAFG